MGVRESLFMDMKKKQSKEAIVERMKIIMPRQEK